MKLAEQIYNHYQSLVETTAPHMMYDALKAKALEHLPEMLEEQASTVVDEAISVAMSMVARDCHNMQCQINEMLASSAYSGALSSVGTADFLSASSRTIA